jgi:hypothetical protein
VVDSIGEDYDKYRAHLREHLFSTHVPGHLHTGLLEYIVSRRRTGGFLEACLKNDLKEAVVRADQISLDHLFHIVFFLFNYAPAPCWGSPDEVEAWLSSKEPTPMVFE